MSDAAEEPVDHKIDYGGVFEDCEVTGGNGPYPYKCVLSCECGEPFAADTWQRAGELLDAHLKEATSTKLYWRVFGIHIQCRVYINNALAGRLTCREEEWRLLSAGFKRGGFILIEEAGTK